MLQRSIPPDPVADDATMLFFRWAWVGLVVGSVTMCVCWPFHNTMSPVSRDGVGL
jgi:hypothetical protein